MQNRRDFIKKASVLMAGGVAAPLLSSCVVTHIHTHTHNHTVNIPNFPGYLGGDAVKSSKYLGLQLYSLRDMVRDDGIIKTLQLVAKMGYNSLETADYNNGKLYGIDPAEFRKIVSDLGMKVTSSHLMRNLTNNRDEDMAWWDRATEAHAAAGMKYMVIPMSPLDGEGATMDNVKRYADYFNAVGLVTAGASIALGYHNHAFEFINKINGVPLYDILVENTSPRHVFFQNDVYWTQHGGYNPVDYLKKYPQRIKTLHIKDEKAIGVSGTMDFKAIFNQAYENGVKDWYVEVEEYYGTPEEDVSKSADYLIAADFVK